MLKVVEADLIYQTSLKILTCSTFLIKTSLLKWKTSFRWNNSVRQWNLDVEHAVVGATQYLGQGTRTGKKLS